MVDTRLQQVESARLELKRLAAEKAVAAASGGVVGNFGEVVGGEEEKGKGAASAPQSAVSSGKRARTMRRVSEMDSEEELAEAEDLLNLSRYKGMDLSHLQPEKVGPLKVIQFPFFYSNALVFTQNQGSGSESPSFEAAISVFSAGAARRGPRNDGWRI
jgi:hypothetical protein